MIERSSQQIGFYAVNLYQVWQLVQSWSEKKYLLLRLVHYKNISKDTHRKGQSRCTACPWYQKEGEMKNTQLKNKDKNCYEMKRFIKELLMGIPTAYVFIGKSENCQLLFLVQKRLWLRSIYFTYKIYRIRPNYRIVRLGFSKILGKLVVKYY